MIRSMTGFGAAAAEESGAHYAIEIRSLNNKYFKSTVRMPDELIGLEAELEAVLVRRLTRGSVLTTVRFFDSSAAAAGEINVNAVKRYLQQLLEVPGIDHGSARIDLGALLTLPGVVICSNAEQLLDRSRTMLLRLADEACDKLLAMRVREGVNIKAELHKHGDAINKHLGVIAERAPSVVEQYQQRLQQRINALLADSGTSVSPDDLIREVAVYAERSDIAEEVSRLSGHLEQFASIINASDKEPSGRTLEFLAQEMLREANTIASKCMDVEVSRRIVEVKGAIDRIKEQAQNIE